MDITSRVVLSCLAVGGHIPDLPDFAHHRVDERAPSPRPS
jgi:hypothetical protein